MNFRTILFLCLVALFTYCGGSSSDQPIPTDSITTPTAAESQIIIELADGVTMDEALSVISTDGVNPEAEVLIAWDDHIANWEVPAGTVEEQKAWIVEQETLRLEELLSDLEEEDEDVDETFSDDQVRAIKESNADSGTAEVASDLSSLKQTYEAPIGIITISTTSASETIQNNSVVSSAETISYDDISSTLAASSEVKTNINKTITDWSADANYVPMKGYSRIRETSTYQSFKLDQQASDALNAGEGTVGVEIKTLIRDRSNAECGGNWSTNLRYHADYAYRDTEFLDGWTGFFDFAQWYAKWIWEHGYPPSPTNAANELLDELSDHDYRICSIGTVDAKLLKVDKRYWIKRELRNVKTENNPLIKIQWAPTRFCEWHETIPSWCNDGVLSFCTCSRDDMPIEELVEHNFNDYNFKKRVRWYRDDAAALSNISDPSDNDPVDEAPETSEPAPSPAPTIAPDPAPAPTPDPTYPTTPPSEGQLIKGDGPTIYMMDNGYKRGIPNEETFVSCGYKWGNYAIYSQATIDDIPEGALWTLSDCLNFSYTSLDLTSQAPVAYSDLATKPFGYTDSSNGKLYVVFNGIDRDIYEFAYNGSAWSSTNLSDQMWVPYAQAGTSPMGFVDPNTGYRYVVFTGSDGLIWMFTKSVGYWTSLFTFVESSWTSTNLSNSVATWIPYADLSSEPYGYIDPITGYIHVLFTGNDRDIYELAYNGSAWSSTNLSDQMWVPYAQVGTSPMGFVNPNTGYRYVVFTAETGDIWMFTWNWSFWTSRDLSHSVSSWVAYADLSTGPYGYVNPSTGYIYVVFNGQNQRIYEFSGSDSNWTATDLSAQDAVPFAEPGTGPIAYFNQLTRDRIVLFMGEDHRVQQFVNNNISWTATDITGQAPVPYGASGTGVSGCYDSIFGTRYAIFNGDNARINMLRFGQ